MSSIIRITNTTKNRTFIFCAPSWPIGVNKTQQQLKAGTHDNPELQADFDDGNKFAFHNLETVDPSVADEAVERYVNLYRLAGTPYHKPGQKRLSYGQVRQMCKELSQELEETKVALAAASLNPLARPYIDQADPDSGEVIWSWQDVATAAKVHGVKVENLQKAVDDKEVKYGFAWVVVE